MTTNTQTADVREMSMDELNHVSGGSFLNTLGGAVLSFVIDKVLNSDTSGGHLQTITKVATGGKWPPAPPK